MTYIVVDKIQKQKIKVSEDDFEFHGVWSENNVFIACMFKHKALKLVFYQDCKKARDRDLRIYPYKVSWYES